MRRSRVSPLVLDAIGLAAVGALLGGAWFLGPGLVLMTAGVLGLIGVCVIVLGPGHGRG